jgi:hypothetical protein
MPHRYNLLTSAISAMVLEASQTHRCLLKAWDGMESAQYAADAFCALPEDDPKVSPILKACGGQFQAQLDDWLKGRRELKKALEEETPTKNYTSKEDLDADVRDVAKSFIREHQRIHNGRVQTVKQYSDHRAIAMHATQLSHDSSDMAHGDGGPKAHEMAVQRHLDAIRAHHEARQHAPSDVVGDHEHLLAHHRAAVRYHDKKAKEATLGSTPEPIHRELAEVK